MTRSRAPSPSTARLLHYMCQNGETPHYGYALMKATGLKSGTLYPILMRLKDRGYLTSDWQDSAEPGRPPRQVYQLTLKGRTYVQSVLSEEPDAHPAPVLSGRAT